MSDIVERLRRRVDHRIDMEASHTKTLEWQAADEITRLRAALLDTVASLAAAISLLERGGKAAKKAAPSDKMFDQMIHDYKMALDNARAALGGSDG